MPDPALIARYADPAPFEVEAQGHRFRFFPHGTDRLEALIELIGSAQQSLSAFYYTFDDDHTGERVRDALIEAARRGVDVRLIIDDFGSAATAAFFAGLTEAGGRFACFMPRLSMRYLIRNHQKFAVADGERVMTGGFNVAKEYFAPALENGWVDLGVRIDGPIAGQFCKWFASIEEWVLSEGSQFRRIRRMVRDWDAGEGPVRLLLGGPTTVTSEWTVRFKRDLADARRLDLVTAYFAPPRSIRRVIARTARRGTARLVLAGKSDIPASVLAARLHYRRLLRSGASLFEFQPTKLHMKMMVVDDISYFGSGNMDMRSTRLNLELMVRVEDPEVAQALRQLVDHLEAASEPITREWYKREHTWVNLASWFGGFFLMKWLDYGISRRLGIGKLALAEARRNDHSKP